MRYYYSVSQSVLSAHKHEYEYIEELLLLKMAVSSVSLFPKGLQSSYSSYSRMPIAHRSTL